MTKTILPKLSNDIHLKSYGYSLEKPMYQRRESLKKASKDIGTLTVLKRTNLIRNYSKSKKENYKKLSKDVKFLKKEYSKQKSKEIKKKSKKSKSKK